MSEERDPRRVVADIQRMLAVAGEVEKVQVRRLADEYAAWMRHALDRLTRCGEYLSQGRGTEALYLAELDPPILTWLGALFFPERDQWAQVVERLGAAMPRPGQDVQGIVRGLNDAYDREQALAEEKRAFRRMVLQNQPPATRLVQARRLMGLDPTSQALQENVRDLERDEQRHLLERARRSASATELAEIHGVLANTPWVETPGEALRREVDGLYGRVRFAHLQNEQARLSRKLTEARAGKDLAEVLRLRPQWDRLASEMGLAPGDPRAHSALRVLAWADRELADTEEELGHVNALDELQAAMARQADEAELWDLYYRLEAFGRRVPREVEQRFQMQVDKIDERRRRREMVIVAAVLGIGATVLVLFLVWLLKRAAG